MAGTKIIFETSAVCLPPFIAPGWIFLIPSEIALFRPFRKNNKKQDGRPIIWEA